MKERELEDRLIDKLRDFILELGYGFRFVGLQHRITLGRNEYFIDFSSISIYTVHALKLDKLTVDKGASPALVGFLLWQNRIAQATLGVTAGPRK